MTDELIFYTNPMSRGRIVRWMLEEIGQPYRTEMLEYGDDEGTRLSGHQPDGEGAGHSARRYRRHRGRRDLRLSRRRFPRGRPRAAARRSPARSLLPLAVLRRRPGRGGGVEQDARLRGAGRTREDDGLRQLCRRHERARGRGVAGRLSGRRQLHRRRCLSRIADRLRLAIRHDREAARLRALLAAHQPAAGRRARQGDRRRADARSRRSRRKERGRR